MPLLLLKGLGVVTPPALGLSVAATGLLLAALAGALGCCGVSLDLDALGLWIKP